MKLFFERLVVLIGIIGNAKRSERSASVEIFGAMGVERRSELLISLPTTCAMETPLQNTTW